MSETTHLTARPPAAPPAVLLVCPLSTSDVVDKILLFIEKFSNTPFYTYQAMFARRIIESILKNDGAIVTGLWSRQCLAKGTRVLMFDGTTKAAEDVCTEDVLMGDDSGPRRVLSTVAGRAPMVRVNPVAGYHESYVVNEDHVLSVKKMRSGSSYEIPRYRSWVSEDVPVKDLLDSRLERVQGYKVPVQFEEKETPIDPYYFGAWLGDGCSAAPQITTADEEIVEYICGYAERLDMNVTVYNEKEGNASTTYAIVNKEPSRSKPNVLRETFKELNVYKNKHIPLIYRANSRRVRLEVLAGLVDTDGHRPLESNKQNVCELIFVSQQLAEDTQWLARSLGFRASVSDKVVNGTLYFRVFFYGPLWTIPTKIVRKRYPETQLREDPLRYGFTLEKLPEDDYYGFEVDGNHRFLLSDCTVTHNCGKTETITWLCLGLAVLMPELARNFPDDDRFKMFSKGFRIGIYAPVEKQSLYGYDRMRKHIGSEWAQNILNDEELNVRVIGSRGDTLTFSNGSVILARTASPISQIEGETHHLAVCEEAQKLLRSKVEKEIRPMLASTNGTMAKIGTAWESRGGFHHSIQQNIEIHKTLGIRNHFEFPWDLVCAEKDKQYKKDRNPFHLNYRKFVDSEIVRLGGMETEEFRMNFRCLWHESRVIAIGPERLRKSELVTVEAEPRKEGFLVAGLDVAKTYDKSVLTLMEVDLTSVVKNKVFMPGAEPEEQIYYRKIILDWLMMEGSFEGQSGQYEKVISYLQQTNVQVLVVDATAMGDPVCERLQAMIGDSMEVIPFKIFTTSKHMLYKYYMQELNADRLFHAAGPQTKQRIEYQHFIQEHLDLDRHMSSGLVVYEAAEGGHDDFPDSAALACWAEKMSHSMAMPFIELSASSGLGGTSARYPRGSGEIDVYRGQSGPVSSRAARYARRW